MFLIRPFFTLVVVLPLFACAGALPVPDQPGERLAAAQGIYAAALSGLNDLAAVDKIDLATAERAETARRAAREALNTADRLTALDDPTALDVAGEALVLARELYAIYREIADD